MIENESIDRTEKSQKDPKWWKMTKSHKVSLREEMTKNDIR